MHIYTDTTAYLAHRERAVALQREAAAYRLARQAAKGAANRRLRRKGKRAATPSVPRQRSTGERPRVGAPGTQAA